jgi:hypothetical protein
MAVRDDSSDICRVCALDMELTTLEVESEVLLL